MDRGKHMTKAMIEKAKTFAIEKHGSQKYGAEPYSFHLAMVSDLVKANHGSPEQIAAAWLHDTVEDTPTTRSEVEREFGAEVASMVWALTGEGENRQERIEDAVRKISDTPGAGLIKLADRYANVTACIDDGLTKYLAWYVSEHEILKPVLPECRLKTQLNTMIERATDMVAKAAATTHKGPV
jgi:(p)ppGpp synthase/HD superfamily hydrolase